MKNEIYKQSLDAAKAEVAKLLQQRKAIDERLAKLSPLVEYLSAFLGEGAPREVPVASALDIGLSEAIRQAFKSASPRFGLTATEVRDRLREQGFNLDKYANELPPIHNTIARLEKAGDLELVTRPDSAKAHRWVSSLKRALLEIDRDLVPLKTLDGSWGRVDLGEPPGRDDLLKKK